MPPDAPRKSGIYALLRCGGGPLAVADCNALSLPAPDEPMGWLAAGHDGQSAAAVFEHRERGCHTLVVGEVEQIGELARTLGMAADSPVAAVAAAALARFGGDTPIHLIGEWSLLQRAADGTVTAMLAAARRDPLLYAQRGVRLAFAPDLFRLIKLDWVDGEFDEAGLLCRMGRAAIRERRGNRTMVRGVRELRPCETLTVAPDGALTLQRCNPLTHQQPVAGKYADLVAQTSDLLTTIMTERAARSPRSAVLLSGGLDSSLLSTFAAAVPNAASMAVCSVAPDGSGLPDEAEFARLVADELGLPFHPDAPAEQLNAYRPSSQVLGGGNGPLLSNRQAQTESFQALGRRIGATMLVNGTYGEMSVTARLPPQSIYLRLRAQAAAVWHQLRPPESADIARYPFHVRIAQHRLAGLSDPIFAGLAESVAAPQWPPQDGQFGYIPGIEKALGMANEFYPGALRMDFPFRDLRLLRLYAGFPLKTLLGEGHDRPVVRTLLKGRLPDAIRLRTRGMPASPDHLPRLQRQAEVARLRIAEFRRAELAEWLDLDWLDASLAQVAARGASDVSEANQVQLTAICAEFLLWLRTYN
jgi:asparagine synthase (glutamine-hydrolysing)